jgi:hypothetical protein
MSALSLATSASAAFVQQGEKLVGEGEVGMAVAGYAVALSADGNTALVGGPCDGDTGSGTTCTGAAWVFTRSGSTWVEQGAKLTPKSGEESPGGSFGESVALSSDGNTALVGGSCEGRACTGAVWVFTRSGSTWTQQGAKFTPSGKHNNRPTKFGSSLALSSDGNTALIGGPADHHGRGAAWVFTRSGSIWTQQGNRLTGSGERGRGEFGESLALAADGNTALIGAPFDHHSRGAAWVFTRSGSTWTQQGGKLTGICHENSSTAGGLLGLFGSSVALSADGNTALVGQPLCGTSCSGPHCHYSARAYTFTRSASVWRQEGESFRESGEGENPRFGERLALSSDGSTALIAQPNACTEIVFCGFAGGVWAFARSGATWTQQGEKLTGAGEVGEGDKVRFGGSLALSSDAKTALIGGPGDNEDIGAAWVFVQ